MVTLDVELPHWPTAGPEEHRLVAEVLDSGAWNATSGKFVTMFEERFAAYHEAPHAVAIANGTVAIIAALQALDLPPGTEVVVPSYTFFATAAAPLALGLVPVYCDVVRGTHHMDPARLRSLLTDRTRAVIPVHLAGAVADMDTVMDIAGDAGIAVVEDAAQAAGVRYRGRPIPVGEMATFSFQSSKNLASGEGGAIVTHDDDLAARLRSYINVGRTPGGGWYEHRNFGLNLRLSELQGAVLVAQLDRHRELQRRRQAGAEHLRASLADVAGLDLPAVTGKHGSTHGQHLFLMRTPRLNATGRDRLVSLLRERGLTGASPGYVPLHTNEALRDARRQLCARLGRAEPEDSCPETERICAETVWLPQPVLLADRETLNRVADVIVHATADVTTTPGTQNYREGSSFVG